jgi:stage III sporulation protein AF
VSAALATWGRNLVALALFGLLAELLLPSRTTEGYVRLVIGLVLLAAVVSPVLGVARAAVGGRLGALPGARAASLPAVLAAEAGATADTPGLVAAAFATEVEHSVVARARTVAGVETASARVVMGGRGTSYGQVTSVTLTLRPTTSAAAAGAALAQRVEATVASALGLMPAQVRVRLLRPRAGPSP